MKICRIFALGWAWLAGSLAAQAHDPLQANTNVSLRPDRMDVEIFMARSPTRLLVVNPPPAPVTEENFESTYHDALQKSAATMVDITLDGQPLKPGSVKVELFEESDIKFTFIYARPPNGRLRLTSAFVKKMAEGYVNSLGLNEDRKVLGFGDLSGDDLAWEINLGEAKGIPSPSVGTVAPPASSPPASSTAVPPRSLAITENTFAIYHVNALGYLVGIAALLCLILFSIFWKSRQKTRSPD